MWREGENMPRLFENEAHIIRSIGQRAIAFGTANAAGMQAWSSKDVSGTTRIAFMFGDSGIVLTAPEAVRVLNAADAWHGVTSC